MTEATVQLEIPVLLPEIEDEQDECLTRFQTALMGKKGIVHVHITGEKSPACLCIHFMPNHLSLESVRRIAHKEGAQLTERFRHVQIPFTGMDSADSALTLRSLLERLPGMVHAQVNYAAGLAFVAYDSDRLAPDAIAATMRSIGIDPFNWPQTAGYAEGMVREDQARYESDDQSGGQVVLPAFVSAWIYERWQFTLVATAGILLAVGWAGETFFGMPAGIALIFFLLSYVAGGYDISTHAIPGLFRGKFDTDVLMLAAAVGAAVLGEWAEGAFLLFLFGLGHAGEHYALDRARNAVNALGALMPSTARVRIGEDLEVRPVSQLRPGDQVFVPPGARIPVDGLVTAGQGAVDQSPITGESVPVFKQPGEEVFAGTINADTALEVEVTRPAADNTLARVIKLVAEAQSQQSPSQRFAERFTTRFVPTVLIFVVLVIVVPPIFGWLPLRDSFYRAMLLLVAASPCALALGTPASVLAGIAQAARNGVLIKGGAHLENLGNVKVMAFDKTGTLTQGRFMLTEIFPVNGFQPNEVLAIAASVEQGSNHPLAHAVVDAAQEEGLSLSPVKDLTSVAGRGIHGIVDGQLARVGSVQMFAALPGFEPIPEIAEILSSLEANGRTVMLVGRAENYMGVIGLADTPRAGIRAMLDRLRATGVSTLVMLTGDHAKVARRVARELGLGDVRAGLLPEQKQQAIQELERDLGQVAMVGDGVNDAPALATATVGIAMGGAGTAVALETADVALMADDLSKLPFAVGLSRASRGIIQQNLGIALGVIAILLVTSVFGLLELSWAVVMHEGSSVLVVLNALRLLGFREG